MGCFEFLPQRRDSEWRNKKHFVDSDSLEKVEKSKPVTPLEGTPEPDVVVEVLTASEPAAVGSVGTKLTQSGSLRKPKDLRDFSYLELKQATKSFHRQNLLGEGGFGQVFKGCIKHKSKFAGEEKVDVAVKQLNSRGQQVFLGTVSLCLRLFALLRSLAVKVQCVDEIQFYSSYSHLLNYILGT